MRRPAKRQPRQRLSWADVQSYPGVFPSGSPDDAQILSRREEIEKNRPRLDAARREVEAQAGIPITGDLFSIERAHVPEEWLANERIGLAHDFETLVEIDFRLRFCRCLLDRLGAPYDRERIIESKDGLEWSYASEIEELPPGYKDADPLDGFLRVAERGSAAWYAALILAHNRRAEFISDAAKGTFTPYHEIAFAREWMLIGELWGEANFIVNYGDDALRGIVTVKSSGRGGDARLGKYADDTLHVLAEMERLRGEGHSRSRAADLTFRKHLGKSKAANEKLWYEHRGRWHKTPET